MPENEQSPQIAPKAPFQNTAWQRGPRTSRARRCLVSLSGVEGRQKTGEARQAAEAEGWGMFYLWWHDQGHQWVGDAVPGAYLALGCPCAAGRPSQNLPLAARRGYRVFLDLLERCTTFLFFSNSQHLFSQRQDTIPPPTGYQKEGKTPTV